MLGQKRNLPWNDKILRKIPELEASHNNLPWLCGTAEYEKSQPVAVVRHYYAHTFLSCIRLIIKVDHRYSVLIFNTQTHKSL